MKGVVKGAHDLIDMINCEVPLADPPTISAPYAVQRRGIKIADPQIERMFDGGQPVLIAVLMESGATQPDDADFLTGTSEGALFQCPCQRKVL